MPASDYHIDAVDRRILRLLARDARLSARAVARELGMSPGAITERVDRLERHGVILGYHAVIDPEAVGFGLEVVVGLRTDQGESLAATLEHLRTIPYVESVRTVAGAWDLLITVQVADHAQLRELLLSNLWRVPGFQHSETLLVLDRVEGEPDRLARLPEKGDADASG